MNSQSRQPLPKESSLREQELLACMIHPGEADDHLGELVLSNEIHWPELIALATRQGVFPLLYRSVQRLPPHSISPHITGQLHAMYIAGTQRSLRLALQLLRLLDLLAEQGIDALAMKGPALAAQAYGALELRNYCDLDVLIHRQDFPQVYEVLVQHGYQPDFPLLDRNAQRRHQRTDKDFKFTYQGDTFEIHWEIADKDSYFPLQIEQFWEETTCVEVLGRPVRTFSPQNAVWMACLHGARHGWDQLKWVADLAHLMHAFPELDWRSIFKQARRAGFYRLLCTGLLLALDPGGATLPEEIMCRIKAEPRAAQLAEKARGWLLCGERAPQPFERLIFFIQNRERARDHLRYWSRWLLTPGRGDLMRRNLPEQFVGLWVILRPMRLARKYGLSFLRSMCKMA